MATVERGPALALAAATALFGGIGGVALGWAARDHQSPLSYYEQRDITGVVSQSGSIQSGTVEIDGKEFVLTSDVPEPETKYVFASLDAIDLDEDDSERYWWNIEDRRGQKFYVTNQPDPQWVSDTAYDLETFVRTDDLRQLAWIGQDSFGISRNSSGIPGAAGYINYQSDSTILRGPDNTLGVRFAKPWFNFPFFQRRLDEYSGSAVPEIKLVVDGRELLGYTLKMPDGIPINSDTLTLVERILKGELRP